MKIHTDTPLAPLTTLKVGGKAKYFTTAKNKEDFIQALNFAKQKRVPHLILGSGSNLLIDDKGFSGLVIHNKYYGIKALKTNIIEVSSGENWDGFVEYTVKKKLWGIECLSGIPGTVGAAPVQNIGAYGQEISETIQH